MRVWRARFCKRWVEGISIDSFQTGITITNEEDGTGLGYLLCGGHYSVLLCVARNAYNIDLDAGTGEIRLQQPLVYVSSFDVITKLYPTVEESPWHVMRCVKWNLQWQEDSRCTYR